MNNDDIKYVLKNWMNHDSEIGIEEVTKGATHKTYRVTIQDSTYILREYKYSDELRIKREHELLQNLEKTNVPCVKLVPTSQRTTLINHKNKYIALFEEVKGEQFDKSNLELHHIKESAKTLADLHKALKGIPSKNHQPIRLEWSGDVWVKRFDTIINAIERSDLLIDLDELILKRVKLQQEWLKNKNCVHKYSFIYSNQIIHGDYHHHNLFFNKMGEVSGILDWDTTMLMPRAYEVIRACSFMFGMDVLLSKEFICTYRDSFPIEIEELDDGANGWGCFSDHHVWPLEETFINKNLAASTFIPSRDFKPFREEWIEVKNGL